MNAVQRADTLIHRRQAKLVSGLRRGLKLLGYFLPSTEGTFLSPLRQQHSAWTFVLTALSVGLPILAGGATPCETTNGVVLLPYILRLTPMDTLIRPYK